MTSDAQAPQITFGQGPRPALALHCTLAHAGAWRGVGAALADTLTLTAIDMLGHGKAPKWSAQGDLHDACTDQAASVLTEPMDVIGHSFGATVALRLAIEHPERVRSLTMIEPVLFAAARLDAPDAMAAHLEEARPHISALEEGDMEQAARLFNRLWGDGTRWDDFRASARSYMADRMYLIPHQTPSVFEDAARLLPSDRIGRVTMPSLLIAGSESPAITRDINAALARRLPNVRAITIDGAGHMAPMSHPQDVASAIRSLIEMA